MLNEAHLAKLAKLIKTSSILTSQERTDWLMLLELMNDKQLAELEEILSSEVLPVVPPHSLQPKSPAPQSLPQHKLPPVVPSTPQLTPQPTPQTPHHNQLPTQKIQPQATQSTPPVVPPRPPIQTQPPNIVAPAIQKPTPSQSKIVTGITPLHHISNLPNIYNTTIPKKTEPKEIIQPIPQPKSASPKTQTQYQPPDFSKSQTSTPNLISYQDVKKINSQLLIDISFDQLLQTLRNFAGEHGYFKILNEFEQSPLYAEYLEYGKAKLAGSLNQSKFNIAQEQFSQVTDLLLALKVNRV